LDRVRICGRKRRIIPTVHIILSLPCGAQERQNPAAVKYLEAALAIVATLYASIALAEDFKTINGKEYKNAEVSRVEADGIVIRTKTGISKVYFVELRKDIQERFLPTPAKTPRGTARAWIELKSWAAAVGNPTSFVLLCVGGASLIVAAVFAIGRSRLQ
jgi:hypothetical protein